MSTEDVAKDRPRDVLGRCLGLFHQGLIPEADRLAEEGLESSPDDGDLWQIKGLLRQRMGDFAGARSSFETASLLVPLSPSARCALADCYARTGQAAPARDLYRHLAGDGRCPTELLPAVASGRGGVGDDEAALGACRELVRRDPARHEAHFGVAYYLRRLGHPAEAALPAVARAHELAPSVPLYRVALASLLAHAGEHEEAYDLLRGVDPRSVGCRCCLGRMMSVFLRAGDVARFGACRVRADRIERPERGAANEQE
jgi:Flp pilus assembly protein TadD